MIGFAVSSEGIWVAVNGGLCVLHLLRKDLRQVFWASQTRGHEWKMQPTSSAYPVTVRCSFLWWAICSAVTTLRSLFQDTWTQQQHFP